MEEEKNGADKFMSIDKFITELINYHEQIKTVQASEAYYRKLAETLQEALNKYQAIVDHLPQKVFLKDKDLFYLFANENFARLFGIPPSKIPGKTDHDFYPFEAAEERLKEDRVFLEKGDPEEKEERYVRDGKEKIEKLVKYPIKNEAGAVVGIVGISWDVTELREKEEERERKDKEFLLLLEAGTAQLKEVQEKLQWEQAERQRLEEKFKKVEGLYTVLFEETDVAFALVEDQKVISRVNKEFEKFFGYSRAEVEGARNWNEFIHDGNWENRGEASEAPDMNFLGRGVREVKVMDRENKEKTVSMTAIPIPDTNNILVSLKDVTIRTGAREELKRALKQFTELMAQMEKDVRDLDG